MPIVIEEMTAEIATETSHPAEEKPAPALPSPQQQAELQRRTLRRLEARKARLNAD